VTKKRIVSRSTKVDSSKTGRKAARGTPAGKQDYLSKQALEELGVDPEQHLSDETCRYCQAKIKPGTQVCPNCGASLVDTGYSTRRCPACERETNEALCPSCGAQTVPRQQPGGLDQKKISTAKTIGAAAIVGILGLVALCMAGLVWLLVPKQKAATVTAVSWTRTMEMEHYEYNRHEGWELPPAADLAGSTTAVHHYDQQLTGYETVCSWEQQVSGYNQVCSSEQVCETISVYDYTETICYDDGTCDDIDHYRDSSECHDETVCRDEPQYQQVEVCSEVPQYVDIPVEQVYYTYDIWEWVQAQPLSRHGSDTTPLWPDVPADELVREAANGRSEECSVILQTVRDKLVTYGPPCSELWQYEVGTEWKVKTLGSSVTDIQP